MKNLRFKNLGGLKKNYEKQHTLATSKEMIKKILADYSTNQELTEKGSTFTKKLDYQKKKSKIRKQE